jgi:hypothetical protein
VFCFDLSDPSSWEQTLDIARGVDVRDDQMVAVCGTKQDIMSASADIEEAAAAIMSVFKMKYKPLVFSCSCTDQNSVEAGFSLLYGSHRSVTFDMVCTNTEVPPGLVARPERFFETFNAWLWRGRRKREKNSLNFTN